MSGIYWWNMGELLWITLRCHQTWQLGIPELHGGFQLEKSSINWQIFQQTMFEYGRVHKHVKKQVEVASYFLNELLRSSKQQRNKHNVNDLHNRHILNEGFWDDLRRYLNLNHIRPPVRKCQRNQASPMGWNCPEWNGALVVPSSLSWLYHVHRST